MGARHVVEANVRGLGRSWLLELLPGLLQSLLVTLVFATLLEGSVDSVVEGGATFGPSAYVIFGVVGVSAAVAGAMETVHQVFLGLKLSERFSTVVTTSTTPAQLAMGHLVWSFLYGASLTPVLLLLLLPLLAWSTTLLVVLPAAAMLSGLLAVALASVLSVFVIRGTTSPQVLNVIGRVVIPPLMLFSATLFPLSVLPEWVSGLLGVLPTAAESVATRAVVAKNWTLLLSRAGVLGVWVVGGAVLMVLALDRELRS